MASFATKISTRAMASNNCSSCSSIGPTSFCIKILLICQRSLTHIRSIFLWPLILVLQTKRPTSPQVFSAEMWVFFPRDYLVGSNFGYLLPIALIVKSNIHDRKYLSSFPMQKVRNWCFQLVHIKTSCLHTSITQHIWKCRLSFLVLAALTAWRI